MLALFEPLESEIQENMRACGGKYAAFVQHDTDHATWGLVLEMSYPSRIL